MPSERLVLDIRMMKEANITVMRLLAFYSFDQVFPNLIIHENVRYCKI
ncbi:hypothetical protein FM107_02275 [Sphingobacterium sp. JB170]|nr:hypothetical protein FM107_02275 [Sphingobacterium sp. JB170]